MTAMAGPIEAFITHLAAERCSGCRECVPVCRTRALLWIVAEQFLMVDPWACTGCGDCITACPEGALRLGARATG